MSKFMSNLSTINSFVRTCLLLGLMGVVGYSGWFGYERYVKPGLQAEAAIAEASRLEKELAASLKKQERADDRKRSDANIIETIENRSANRER